MNLRRSLMLSMPGIVLLATAGVPLRSVAGKANKLDVYYQDKPKDGKHCAACRQYTPSASGVGVCALVEGNVSADGWCMAYAPRDAS